MKKLKSTLPNMALVLTLIAVIAAAALASVNEVTKGPIEENKAKTLAEGIKAVLGGQEAQILDTKTVQDANDNDVVIYATDKGVAVKAIEPKGFGGPLTVLVGFDEKGSIKGYTVLEHAETPGLGAKASFWFQEGEKGNIIGMNPGEKALSVSKDGGQVDAITASTITSRAFLRAVNVAFQAYAGASSTDAESGASTQQHVKSEPQAAPEASETPEGGE